MGQAIAATLQPDLPPIEPARMRAAGALVGQMLAAFPALVQDTHRGISGRVFGALGEAGRPVRVVHDGIATAVYGSVRATTAAAPRLGARAMSGVGALGGPAPRSSRLGRMAH